MKKLWIGLLIVLAIAAIFALDHYNILRWQPISMIIAAIAAPFKFIINMFTNKEEEIRKQHAALRQAEAEFQTRLKSEISEREQRVQHLHEEISRIDTRIATLKQERARIDREVDNMSLEELAETGRRIF